MLQDTLKDKNNVLIPKIGINGLDESFLP